MLSPPSSLDDHIELIEAGCSVLCWVVIEGGNAAARAFDKARGTHILMSALRDDQLCSFFAQELACRAMCAVAAYD